jgi:hypothetical protein
MSRPRYRDTYGANQASSAAICPNMYASSCPPAENTPDGGGDSCATYFWTTGKSESSVPQSILIGIESRAGSPHTVFSAQSSALSKAKSGKLF